MDNTLLLSLSVVRMTVQMAAHVRILLSALALIAALPNNTFAQTISLSFPESVAFDPNTRTYLVSSALTGAIVRRAADGTLSPFASAGLSTAKGIVVAKFGTIDALWVADNRTFKAFNLATGAELAAFLVPNSFEINDVAADSANGIFYISDPAVGVFRASVTVSSGGVGQATFAQIVQPDVINSPNGITFDRANNRLVVVSFAPGTAQIHAVNLRTTPPTVQTLATTAAGSGSLDGIARDKQGRYYISSWEAGSVIRYDSNFTTPTVFASGFENPADIFFNAATDTLVVPNFNRNTLDFLRVPPLIASSVRSTELSAFALELAPNPAFEQTILSYTLEQAHTVSLVVLNVLGETVMTLETSHKAAGRHQALIPLSATIPSGVYYCRLQAGGETAIVRLNVVR